MSAGVYSRVGRRPTTLVFAGLALTRLRRRWRLALSMEIGLVLAVALAVSVALVQSVTAEIGLRRALDGLGDQGWVQITAYGAGSGAALDAFPTSALGEAGIMLGSVSAHSAPASGRCETRHIAPAPTPGRMRASEPT